MARGRAVAPGLIIDANGQPTTDPNDFYAGGSLLPFGGHKGSGLSIMVELAGGVLSGMGASPMEDYAGGNGTVLVALDIEAFMPLEEYLDKAGAFWAEAKRIGAGTSNVEVFMPGEIEDLTLRPAAGGRGIRRQTRSGPDFVRTGVNGKRRPG